MIEQVYVYSAVVPVDGSETLPVGSYVIGGLRWITYEPLSDKPYRGLATFYVASGQHAGPKRRIGHIFEENEASRRLFVAEKERDEARSRLACCIENDAAVLAQVATAESWVSKVAEAITLALLQARSYMGSQKLGSLAEEILARHLGQEEFTRRQAGELLVEYQEAVLGLATVASPVKRSPGEGEVWAYTRKASQPLHGQRVELLRRREQGDGWIIRSRSFDGQQDEWEHDSAFESGLLSFVGFSKESL